MKKKAIYAIVIFVIALAVSLAYHAFIGLAKEPAHEEIIEYVQSFADEMRENDELIEWETNVWIKKSNVHGVNYRGEIYYYSLSPHMSYDPVLRGEVAVEEVEIIHKSKDENHPIIIYKIIEHED